MLGHKRLSQKFWHYRRCFLLRWMQWDLFDLVIYENLNAYDEKILEIQNFVLTHILRIWRMKYLSINQHTQKCFNVILYGEITFIEYPNAYEIAWKNKDSHWSQKKDRELLGDETSYLIAVRAVMHLAKNTIPDIFSVVNLLERLSSSPTKVHSNSLITHLNILEGSWTWIYSISRNPIHNWLVMEMHNIYMHKARSQKYYLLTYGGTLISWQIIKQTLITTSSNHAEIKALREASRECIWLRSMAHHIQKMCVFHFKKNISTIIYEDN